MIASFLRTELVRVPPQPLELVVPTNLRNPCLWQIGLGQFFTTKSYRKQFCINALEDKTTGSWLSENADQGAIPVEYLCMTSEQTVARIEDLRFALTVMEEHSHLGLDAEFASKLRSLMLRRIAKTEVQLSALASMSQ